MLGKQYLILIFGILAFVFFAGCVEVAKAPVDAIAVWQHEGAEGWDVWYSLWDYTGDKWHVPGGGQAAPIATDAGNDHDPDVSSYSDTAVAVWSKEDNNRRTIYFSKWKDYSWSGPSAISSAGEDTDPTVAMDKAENAIAVWVHDKKELYYSVYNSATNSWSTPKKIDTSGIDKVSLPELTYSEYWDSYFLIFTGINEDDGKQYSYEMFYWGGWHGPWWIDYDAVLDNSEPTDQRTGISADWHSGFVTYVWPVTDGTLESYSYKYDFATYTFNLYGTGKMPDVAYDSADVANGLYTKTDDLYHQPDVNSPVAELLVSNVPSVDYRVSVTSILMRNVGLAAWWNKEDGVGEIYYSYNDGTWSTPNPIVGGYLKGYDRNPAVTPIEAIEIEEEIGPYCGDGALDAGEQCEVGVPCPNPNDVCWPDCKCYPIYYPYCGDGALDAGEQCEVGVPCPKPDELCWIDCKCYKGKRPPPQPPPEEPPPLPPQEPPEEEEEEPEPTTSCKGNSAQIERVGINTFDPSRQVCSDDCEEGYVCDAYSCNCLPATAVITPRCGDGYISTPDVPGGGREECDTGNAANPKPDTCPYPEVCVNCKCIGPADSVTCAGNTLGVDRTDVNRFNPETMMCTDDCSLTYSDAYECNMRSCTCTLKNVTVVPECGNGEVESGEDCENDGHCVEGYRCINCRCVYEEVECEDNEDCPEGEECVANECVPVTEPVCGDGVTEGTEECESKGECPEYHNCLDCRCVPYTCYDFTNELMEMYTGTDVIILPLGEGYESFGECEIEASLAAPYEECMTSCWKAHYFGPDGCCVLQAELLPCIDCPYVCPECPPEYGE